MNSTPDIVNTLKHVIGESQRALARFQTIPARNSFAGIVQCLEIALTPDPGHNRGALSGW